MSEQQLPEGVVSNLPKDFTKLSFLADKWIRITKPRFFVEPVGKEFPEEKLYFAFDAVDLSSGEVFEKKRYSVGPSDRWQAGADGKYAMGLRDPETGNMPTISGNCLYGRFLTAAVANGLNEVLITSANIAWIDGMEMLFGKQELEGIKKEDGSPIFIEVPIQVRPAGSTSASSETSVNQAEVEAALIEFFTTTISNGQSMLKNELTRIVGSTKEGPFKSDAAARTRAVQIVAIDENLAPVLERAGLRSEGGIISREPVGAV